MSPRAKRHRRRHKLQQLQLQHPRQPRQDDGVGLGDEVSAPNCVVISNKDGFFVQRSMPTILSGRMDLSSWNLFCDEIDEALEPLAKMKHTMKMMCFYPLVIFIPVVLIGLVATTIAASQSADDSSGSKSMKKALSYVFLVAFFISILWAIGMAVYSSRCRKKVGEEVERVCSKTSAAHPEISFKVYVELQCIQVTVPYQKPDIEMNDTSSCSTSGDDSNVSPKTDLPPIDLTEAKKWKSAIDEKTNTVYYFNEETKEVTWTNPFEIKELNCKEEGNANDVEGGGRDRKDEFASADICDLVKDAGFETSIVFKQVPWETPLEADEMNEDSENDDNGNGSIEVVQGIVSAANE